MTIELQRKNGKHYQIVKICNEKNQPLITLHNEFDNKDIADAIFDECSVVTK